MKGIELKFDDDNREELNLFSKLKHDVIGYVYSDNNTEDAEYLQRIFNTIDELSDQYECVLKQKWELECRLYNLKNE